MTYSDPQTFGTGTSSLREPGTTTWAPVLIERIRQALAAALVVGLIALAVFGGQDPAQAPDVQSNTTLDGPATETAPDFDGRGKWGGYAR